MAKILVTGSTGFIGKSLIANLNLLEHDIEVMDRSFGDITDPKTWDNFTFSDIVIHLAALTFVPNSWNEPYNYINTNLLGTICALEYCKKYEAKLIFLSTYMYGTPESLPIPENAKLCAFNPYALSKKMSEDACLFYANNFNIKVIVLRPFNVYGPGQSIDFLIPSIINQALAGEEVTVKVLEPKRDYVYIDDLVNFIIATLEFDHQPFTVFNVGTGKSYSVAELINIIQQSLGTNLPVKSSGEKRQQEVMDTRADITKAAELLKWSPSWTLKQGIGEILSFELKKGKS